MPYKGLRCWLLFIALAGVALFARGTIAAQDKKSSSSNEYGKDGKQVEERKFDIPYWDRSESFQIRAAVALIGEANPLGVLGARMAISENVPTVDGWDFFFDKALPINRTYLDVIRDGRLLPDLRAKEIRDLKVPDQGLYLAYLQALRRSHAATLDMFQNSAAAHENVSYTHLAADPKLYRGEIITVKGKLTAIRDIEAPPLVQQDGISKIYQGWIIGPTKGALPFAVVFTQLPKELKVSEKVNTEVTFQGYFLSNILIPADKERGNTKTDLTCPWLIGKTLMVPEPKAAAVVPAASYDVVIYTFGTIFAIGVLIGLLNLYFRRGDRNTQAQIAKLREQHQPFSLDDEDSEGDTATDIEKPESNGT